MRVFNRMAEAVGAVNAGLKESAALIEQERAALEDLGKAAESPVFQLFGPAPGGVLATMSASSSGRGATGAGGARSTRDVAREGLRPATGFANYQGGGLQANRGDREIIAAINGLPRKIAGALGGDGGAAVRARGGF